ncbi:MAG: hypothetical protein GYA16_12205 [Spirochaetes bacterium]|nr:hypothetical protein [Spirochaetota bacterium]
MKINIKVSLAPGVDDDIIMYFSADSTVAMNRKVKQIIREYIKSEKGILSVDDKLAEILRLLRSGNFIHSNSSNTITQDNDSDDINEANNNLDNLLKGFK